MTTVMTGATTLRVFTFVAAAGLFAGLTAARVEAQRFGRLPQPRAGACFYRDANFRGDYFCVRSDDAIDALPNDLNDQISSIRMLGGEVEVTANDKLSSLRVQRPSRRGRPDRDRDRDRDGNRGFTNDSGSGQPPRSSRLLTWRATRS